VADRWVAPSWGGRPGFMRPMVEAVYSDVTLLTQAAIDATTGT
jgi:hypothetical protein